MLPIPKALPGFMIEIAVIPPCFLSTVTFTVALTPVVDPTPTAFAFPSLLTVGNVRSAELTNYALKYTSSLSPPVPYPPPLLAILTEEIPLNP